MFAFHPNRKPFCTPYRIKHAEIEPEKDFFVESIFKYYF